MPYKAATLRLHAGLPKAHSSLLAQIRTGKIGLAAFLHKCRVPGFESPACSCGWQWETAKHITLDCPRFSQERRQLQQTTRTTDFQWLISDPRGAAALTTWFLRLNLLPQFSWAREQLPPPPPLLDCFPVTQHVYSLSTGWLPPRGRRGGFSS